MSFKMTFPNRNRCDTFGWNIVSKSVLSLSLVFLQIEGRSQATVPDKDIFTNQFYLCSLYLYEAPMNDGWAVWFRFIFQWLSSFLPSFLAEQLILVVHLEQVLVSPKMIHLMLWQVWDELSHTFHHQRLKVISKAKINKNSFEVFLTGNHRSDPIPWTVQYKLNVFLVLQKKKRFTTRESILVILFLIFFPTSPNPTQ